MLRESVLVLERSAKREGGNIEYIKNIVLQYLCTNDFDVRPVLLAVTERLSDRERQDLFPVISTILEFSPAEKDKVLQSRSAHGSFWTRVRRWWRWRGLVGWS
jgi:hypothetical protein